MKIENSIENYQGTRHRWMIVDDDSGVLVLFSSLATQFTDVDIACYNSPHTALAAFATAPESYQLVITDLEMPGMDGIHFCRQLRAIAPQTRILLATGSRLLTKMEALQRGFCGLLKKPFPITVMKDALAAAGLQVGWREPALASLIPA